MADDELEIDQIIDHHHRIRRREFLVQFITVISIDHNSNQSKQKGGKQSI